jgi:predicted O-methyltransferase YrrM
MLHFRAPRTLRGAIRLAEGMTNIEGCEMLYNFAREARGGCIVEVGSYRGRSAVALGKGSLDGHRVPVYAIEPHAEFVGERGGVFGPADRAAFYQAMLRTGCYEVVRLVNLSSENVAPNWSQPIRMLFIDGDHSEQGVRRDWNCWSPKLTADAVVAFDDAKWPGPAKLIEELLRSGWQKIDERGEITVLRRNQ